MSLLSLAGLAMMVVSEVTLKRIIFVVVSLATGGLFADALLDLLPESCKCSGASAGLFWLESYCFSPELLNFFGAAAILRTLLALFVGSRVESFSHAELPFAACGFIYIAGSDLLPKRNSETSVPRSLIQLLAMAIGAGTKVCLIFP